MERKLEIGMHLVFVDPQRQERDALLICMHGDPMGRLVVARKKANPENPSDLYETDEKGDIIMDYIEAGQHWPCINIVVADKNDGAQDQYGRQTVKETSVVYWKDSTAHGYCWRFPDEKMEGLPQPSVS